MKTFDAPGTAELLPYADLIQHIEAACLQYERGEITSPPRLVLPLSGEGVLLSMPATAPDIGTHKLVTVQPRNKSISLPTIHGLITVCDGTTGRPVCQLDGQVVTGRRTAAVSLLAIRKLLARPPQKILVIGTGTQAAYHVEAILDVYPDCEISVKGSTPQAAGSFCQAHPVRPASEEPFGDADAVITLTTSRQPVYNEEALRDRLVVGVGAFKPEMAEIGPATLHGSVIYADDPEGARHEAGDLLQAQVDWKDVRSLAAAVRGEVDWTRPRVFKSVGSAAWDLAACRAALQRM